MRARVFAACIVLVQHNTSPARYIFVVLNFESCSAIRIQKDGCLGPVVAVYVTQKRGERCALCSFERRNNNDDDGGDDDDKVTGREKKRSGAQGGDRRPGQNSVAAVARLCLLCVPPTPPNF